ncbi:MAG: helix-turn-helix domain-containing protein [Thermodesulfobacteriota bacterium]
MGRTLQKKLSKLDKKRREKIKARAAELIAEEMTMRDLRNARKLTQKAVAKKLGISQDNVSRLESRSDVLLSTLREYVHSLGGELSIVAEFPDRPPVLLADLAAIESQKKGESEASRKSKS